MTIISKKKNWNLCSQILLKCLYLARIGRPDILVSGQPCEIDCENGPELVTNTWIAWYPTFITHVNLNSLVMWVILQKNAGWECFKTPILREMLRTQNLLQVEHCALPGEWGRQGRCTTGGGGLARVPNLRVCKHLFRRVAHAGVEGWINILPWYRLVGVAIPPVSREGGRAGLPKEGKWPPRGTGTTVLTYPLPSQPCFGGSKECARVTGKAGENGQNSGEMGGSSPWRPSAPGCGDTLTALAGDQRPI